MTITVVMTIEDAERASDELLRSLWRNDANLNPTGEQHRAAGCAVLTIISGDLRDLLAQQRGQIESAITILRGETPIVPTA